MTLHPRRMDEVPADTHELAWIMFPKGHAYMHLRDELGALFRDEDYAGLYSLSGQSAESPAVLVLVLVLQELEGLSDRQAADAVRGHVEWRYFLGLGLREPTFDYSVLSEFRARLLAGGAEQRVFERVLKVCQEKGWLKARGKQRTDATRVLSAARELDRLACVAETLRHALEVLVDVAPSWLGTWLAPEWGVRYGRSLDTYRLPKDEAVRRQVTLQVGTDGYAVLTHVYAADAPAWLREVEAVETLRQVWVQQYQLQEEQVQWRTNTELPPAEREIRSPYDTEARYASKRGMGWNGYKVHYTETCEADMPHLITSVITTPATTPDVAVLPTVHDQLAAQDLLPSEHMVDEGYADAVEFRHAAQAHQVEVVGRLREDPSWQAHQGQGYDQTHFQVDWEHERVICPQGQASRTWHTSLDPFGNTRYAAKFAVRICEACPVRTACTQAHSGGRTITIPPREVYEALHSQRIYQTTPEFKQRYTARAGIEGTLSQGVNSMGLRTARYFGLAKTHLQHLFTAIAINLTRVADWIEEVPRATTRHSRLERFAVALPL